jgi:hypothetical protein
MVLVFPFLSFQVAQADTGSLESKALAYVQNVLPLDMAHYIVTVHDTYSLPAPPNDPTITQAVGIDLNSSDSAIHVVCVYINGRLHQCGVTPVVGSPVSDRVYGDLVDAAVRILHAHQEQTGLDSTPLLTTLKLLNDTQANNVTVGDVSLRISHFPDIVGVRTVNGHASSYPLQHKLFNVL